jgi:hypothetical protein
MKDCCESPCEDPETGEIFDADCFDDPLPLILSQLNTQRCAA